jgi:hypothetical protein
VGLLLLIPGLLFQFNGTEWFAGEDKIAVVLIVVGVILLALQILWGLYVASKVRQTHQEIRRRRGFDTRF